MVAKIIGLFGGLFAKAGLAKAQGFLKGKKSYALGTVTILQGVVGLWVQLAGAPDFGAALADIALHSSTNPNVAMILAGAAMFTLRAGLDNSAAKAAAVDPQNIEAKAKELGIE